MAFDTALEIVIKASAETAIATINSLVNSLADIAIQSQTTQQAISTVSGETARFAEIVSSNTLKFGVLSLGAQVPFLGFLGVAVEVNETIAETRNAIAQLDNQFFGAVDAVKYYGDVSIPTLETVRKSAFDLFREFDKARAKVQTLTSDSQALATQMRAIAQETDNQYSSTVLLNSAYDVLSSGFSDTAAVSMIMTNSVKLAKAGFTELGTASDTVTTILNAYGLAASDAEMVANQLIQTQNLGKLTVDQYGRSIGQVASIAAQSGIGLQEMNAVIATATISGIGASESMTGLRQAISAIFNPTKQAQEVAAQLGVDFSATALKTGGLEGVLKQLNATGKATPDVLVKLFGSLEAVSVITPVLANNMATFDQNLNTLSNSASVLDEAFGAVTTSLDSDLQKLQNRFNESLLSMGEGIANWTRNLIKQGEPVLQFFENLNPQNQLKAFEGLQQPINAFGEAMKAAYYQTTWLAGFTVSLILVDKFMQSLVITSTGVSLSLDIAAGKGFLFEAASKAAAFATAAWGYAVDVFTGKIATQTIALDFAATKTAVLTFAQNNLGTALGFVSLMLQNQVWIWANFVNWATDGVSVAVAWLNAQVTATAATTANAAAVTGLTLATNALNASWTYFKVSLLPIIVGGLTAGIKNLVLLVPNLIGLFINLARTASIYSLALVNAIANTNLLTFSTGALATVKLKLGAALTFVQAKLVEVGITQASLVAGTKLLAGQFLILTGTIIKLAAKLAVFVLAFDAVGNTLQLFRQSLNALTGSSFGDEFEQQLEKLDQAINFTKDNSKNIFDQATESFGNFINSLGSGQDRAKGFIDNIAIAIVNLTNILSGGQSAASKYGEEWRLITQAQLQAQQQVIAWEERQSALNAIFDQGTDLINRYGLATLEATDRTRLGADGIKAFKDEAAKQIETINRNIESLKNLKTEDKELQASIQATIKLYEQQKNSIAGRIAFLESEAKATTETAISIKGLTASYESEIKALETSVNQKKILLQEQLASGVITADQLAVKVAAIEKDSYSSRLGIAAKFQQQLKAVRVGVTDENELKAITEQQEKIEADSWKTRESIAKAAIQNREKIEKEAKDNLAKLEKTALDKFTETNKAAEVSLRMSQSERTQEVKQALLGRSINEEQAAIEFAQIAQDSANKEILIIQDKITRINALELSSVEGVKNRNDQLLKLQEDLATANIRAIDLELEAQKVLQAQKVAAIEATGQREILGLENKVNAQNAFIESVRSELDLLSARSGLQAAQAALDEGRLQNQIDQELSIERKAQLEVDLARLQSVNLQKQFDGQEATLRLTQLQTQAELERQLVVAQIARIEADIALQKAVANKATAQEIAGLTAILQLRDQQISQSEQAISRQQEINGLQTEELRLKRLKATEDNQAEIKANGLQDVTSRIAQNIQNSANATQNLTTGIEKATEATNKLNRSFADTVKALQAPVGGNKLLYEFSDADPAANINKVIEATKKLLSLNNTNPFGGGGFNFDTLTGKAIQEQRAALEKAYGLSPGASTLAGSFARVGNIPTSGLNNLPQGGVGRSQQGSINNSVNNSRSMNQTNTIQIIDSPDPYGDLTKTLLAIGRI